MPLPTGAKYVSDFVSKKEASFLINEIDASAWRSDLRRRVQHYGYRYDYRARMVGADDHLGPLPAWLDNVCSRLVGKRFFPIKPDQVIVNEYEPGQGIAPHVDCVPCFAGIIASLSLGSQCEMVFANVITRKASRVLLEPNSLLILSDKARYDWTHAIPARKSDIVCGSRVARGKRLSLTFRNVTLA